MALKEFATEILNYRGAKKTLGTYVENYQACINGDGRVHPEYKILRTLTGRSSAVNENVQNLPREYKDFFGAPPGKVLLEVDWSAIEFRVAAWSAQESVILDKFAENPEWDPHRFFASKLYGRPEKEITKAERQIAKSGNFGLLYLGNGHTLVEYCKGQGILLTIQEANDIYETWHYVFPGFRGWYQDTREELLRNNEVRTATGFIRHYSDVSVMPLHLRAAALRESVNVKVQGLAAHIAYMAMGELDRLGMPLTGFIHDAFLFEFEPAEAEKQLPVICDVMCNYPAQALKKLFDVDFNVPLTVEAKYFN